jgi:regulator of extracellular matrix RemA (YlzA/DUF370 family)
MRSLPPLEAYLNRLEAELRKHGSIDKRVIEEAREHLLDAIQSGLERGLSIAAAEHEAFSSFGSPETVAAAFAEERNGMNNRLFVLLNSMVSVLRGSQRDAGHYHDVGGPCSFHFAVCLKRPWRNRFKKMSAAERDGFIAEMRERGEDVSAFEADPRERLVQFLRDFAGRKFNSTETLESLTLLEDTTDSSKRGGRYLAAFSGGTKMIWTVALTTDGGVSFDGTNAPA